MVLRGIKLNTARIKLATMIMMLTSGNKSQNLPLSKYSKHPKPIAVRANNTAKKIDPDPTLPLLLYVYIKFYLLFCVTSKFL